jgi:hypothetical protein
VILEIAIADRRSEVRLAQRPRHVMVMCRPGFMSAAIAREQFIAAKRGQRQFARVLYHRAA